MQFRPCIDIHNGRVKQIVGGSLKDEGNSATDNFVSQKDAAWYANLFKENNLKGAHVILLNSIDSEFYEDTKSRALSALREYPNSLQIGGGITAENAGEYLKQGASHVIVTSYVFKDGKVNYENLRKLKEAVGKEHVVLDLSARKRDGRFYVVTDRWQKFTDEEVNEKLFFELSLFCDEFLVHGVDVEGKKSGLDEKLIGILANASKSLDCTITYAGGISSLEDIAVIDKASEGRLHFTVGSALDIYGGTLKFDELVKIK